MIIVPTEKRFDWKRSPLMLIGIVVLNVLVFFLYQSGDSQKYTEALELYYNGDFFEAEWPEFKQYLKANNKQQTLHKYQELYQQEEYETLAYYMLENKEFNDHLQQHADRIVGRNRSVSWLADRNESHFKIRSMSHISQGLDANNIQVWNLISHQFLHGDLMHLVGNLIFLVLCGFAVEAAIGHLRFLGFYLLSGICGGLLYAVLNSDDPALLVGASGAISGVMAMYLGVFRLKRIEFFYWFLVFVGYIRLPALMVLPFYIGLEFYNLFNSEGSNVAFMAHVGGFVAGGMSMGLLLLISPKVLDEEYVEEDQSLPSLQKDLAIIYQLIERLQFERAGIALNGVIDKYGTTFELALLRYKMLQVNKGQAYRQSIVDLIGIQQLSETELRTLATIWKDNHSLQDTLPDKDVLQLAMKLSPFLELGVAEEVFKRLQDKSYNPQSLGVLSRKISLAYQRANNRDKQQKYEQLAERMLMGRNVMSYCKYHPLEPAMYACHSCNIPSCDSCIDDGGHKGSHKCFICSDELDSLGGANGAEPFWRRLQASFLYPLSPQTIIFILVVSFLTPIVLYLPFGFILGLVLVGSFMKYCFACLEETAMGAERPPDITVAYSGGLSLMLKLIALIIVIAFAFSFAVGLLGETLSTILAVCLLLGVPAMLINFGSSGRLLEGMNPITVIRLISAIGLPYGLLLVFLAIMFFSAEAVNSFIGDGSSYLQASLHQAVNNYYAIVAFQLMGYMVFQYQRELGFTARVDDAQPDSGRPEQKVIAAKIEVLLKEGSFDAVAREYAQAIQRYPNDPAFHSKCFDFLCASKNSNYMNSFASKYLRFLLQTGRQQLLASSFKKIVEVVPRCLPDSAELRVATARACWQAGTPRLAVKLINGLHKEFPDYRSLAEAYLLMAEALDDIPKMFDQAGKSRKLAAHFEKQKPTDKPQSNDAAERSVGGPVKEKGSFLFIEDSQKDPVQEMPAYSAEEKADKHQPKDLPPIEFS